MKIAIQVYSNNIPLWIEKVEQSLREIYQNASIDYIIACKSINKDLNPFSNLYKILDSKLTPPNSPFQVVKKVTQPKKGFNYDFLINLSFQEPLAKINAIKTFEIAFENSDYTTPFNPLIESFKLNKEVIKILIKKDSQIIYTLIEGIDMFSYTKTIHNIFTRLHFDITQAITNKKTWHYPIFSNNRIFSTKSPLQRILQLYLHKITNRWKWDVIITNKSNEILKKVKTNKRYFYADPFIKSNNNYEYLFMERLSYKERKADLVVRSSHDNFSKEKVILKKDYHLSYPHIFKLNNKWYLIPETSENYTVQLYESESFPTKWKFVKNIIEGEQYVDSTLLFYNNYYYLFTNSKPDPDSTTYSKLNIYFTDCIFNSKLKKHPTNHLIDSRFARQAGEFIKENGNLYRVSQNNSKFYGLNITIHKVIKLCPKNYKEEIVESFGPELFELNEYKGLHTLNQSDNLKVFDVIYS